MIKKKTLLAAAPSTPSGSEVPSLAVVTLEPRAERAPPIDVRTQVQEPDAELVAALSRPSVVANDAFFFQAEDGIRALTVTGVQTCALPICGSGACARCRPPCPR